MTKKETTVGIVAVVILAAFVTAMCWLHPFVHYSVRLCRRRGLRALRIS